MTFNHEVSSSSLFLHSVLFTHNAGFFPPNPFNQFTVISLKVHSAVKTWTDNNLQTFLLWIDYCDSSIHRLNSVKQNNREQGHKNKAGHALCYPYPPLLVLQYWFYRITSIHPPHHPPKKKKKRITLFARLEPRPFLKNHYINQSHDLTSLSWGRLSDLNAHICNILHNKS